MNRIEKIASLDTYSVYRYIPSLINLFGKYYPEKITIRRIIRFVLALPSGYEIFSLVDNEKALGYCTIQSGKSKRYDYTNDNDISVGPYVIMPEYQGQGLAAELIKVVLDYKKDDYIYAYAYIKNDNYASIKTCEKNGFNFYSYARVTSLKADVKISEDPTADYIIMRRRNK